jgi:thiol-disulfide isomerase/thioredoxin
MSRVMALVVVAFLLLGSGRELVAQASELKIGDPAPRVMVHDLNGKPVNLGRYVGSKPVFLEFWATWCESCRELLPHLRAARQRFGDKVEFLGINVAVNQSPDSVREYLTKHDPDFQTLYDDEGTSTRAYQVPATSYVVIVDRSGKIAYTGVGGTQSFDRALEIVSQ